MENGPVSLTEVNPQKFPLGEAGTSVGQLTGFTTDDQTLACLSSEPGLNVYEFASAPSEYVVIAQTPTDCATGTFTFPVPPAVVTGPSTTPK